MKRKKSPPSEFLINAFDQISGDSKEEIQNKLRALLTEVRYAGDIKQLAERCGLHYLKSKRMRTRELREWIINNHIAVKEAEDGEVAVHHEIKEELRIRMGVALGDEDSAVDDWMRSYRSLRGSTIVRVEVLPDGSFKVLPTEVGDGAERSTKPDRRGGQG